MPPVAQCSIKSQGDGTFEAIDGAILTNFDTRAIAVADVNNDGFIDIIIGNDYEQFNRLLLNDGNGTFQEMLGAIPGEYQTYSIAVADMNGDGVIDIIVVNVGDPNQILLNQGDSTFKRKLVMHCPPELKKHMTLGMSQWLLIPIMTNGWTLL